MIKLFKFVFIIVIIVTTINLYSQTDLESENGSPDQSASIQKDEINFKFSQINPKFKFKDFTIYDFSELDTYQYQLPDSLLPDLTIEEIIFFLYEDPTRISLNPKFHYDINNFNGFRELISRPSYNDELIKLLDNYYSNPAKFYNLYKLLFVLSIESIQDYLNIELKNKVLITLKDMVTYDPSTFSDNISLYHIEVVQMDFYLLAAIYLQDFYNNYFDYPHLYGRGRLVVSIETLANDLEMVIREKKKQKGYSSKD